MRLSGDVRLAPGALPGIIALTLERNRTSSIRFLDLERGRVLEFPASVSNAAFPAFSSNGELLTFTGSGNNGRDVFVSRWSGEALEPITFNARDEGNPSFNAADDAVFFFSEINGYEREIHRASLAQPLRMQRVTRLLGQSTTPVESPDAKWLAFTTDKFDPAWNVCLRNQQSGKTTCPFKDLRHSNCRAHWSPDGSKIVFSMELGEEIDLYLYDLTTKQRTHLTDLPGREYDAVWSPDGEYIAFAHSPKGSNTFSLKVIEMRTRTISSLAESPDGGSLRYLSWGPTQAYTLTQHDLCPADPHKTEPEMCGCGAVDVDRDNDGISSCLDQCPFDERKIQPGACGCGLVEKKICESQPKAPSVSVRRVGNAYSIVTVNAPSNTTNDLVFYLRLPRRVVREQTSKGVFRYRTNQRGAVRAAWREIEGGQSLWSPAVLLR
jgi:hypothetical protein